MKKNTTLSLSQEAISMLEGLYKKLIKSTGTGSRSAVVERLIREEYQRKNNDTQS